MEAICVDASVAAKWLLDEQYTEQAVSLLLDASSNGRRIVGPPHIRVEVTSAVYKQLRAARITIDEALGQLEAFAGIPIEVSMAPVLPQRAIEIAHSFGWSLPYDAFYLALGELLDCEVWTADERFYRDASAAHGRLRLIADYPA